MISQFTQLYRRPHLRGLFNGSLLLALIFLTGTLGYFYIGRPRATWIDSFYMTFITISTIGYGEVIDLSNSPQGRLFTVFIAVTGIGTMSYLFSRLVAILVDNDLNAGLRRKRMEKAIGQLHQHYIVCGIGRVGGNVAQELSKSQRPFVVIENQREALDRLLERHPHSLFLHDDAAEESALLGAGVMRAAGVFAVTGDDSHNLMVALSVKLLNPQCRVVVRVHDIRNANKARRAGADEVVSPDFTGGMRIASAMIRPHVVNFMDQMLNRDDGLRVEEIKVPHYFQARTVAQLLPKSPDYLLMATRKEAEWVFNPSDDQLIEAGEVLVLMANPGGRLKVEHVLGG